MYIRIPERHFFPGGLGDSINFHFRHPNDVSAPSTPVSVKKKEEMGANAKKFNLQHPTQNVRIVSTAFKRKMRKTVSVECGS